MSKPNYHNGAPEPDSIRQMAAMMQPAPPILDPTTIALNQSGRIYFDMKSKILLGDKDIETIRGQVEEAKARCGEIASVEVRTRAVAHYDKMLATLAGGGRMDL